MVSEGRGNHIFRGTRVVTSGCDKICGRGPPLRGRGTRDKRGPETKQNAFYGINFKAYLDTVTIMIATRTVVDIAGEEGNGVVPCVQ